jgi:hypothetical protein
MCVCAVRCLIFFGSYLCPRGRCRRRRGPCAFCVVQRLPGCQQQAGVSEQYSVLRRGAPTGQSARVPPPPGLATAARLAWQRSRGGPSARRRQVACHRTAPRANPNFGGLRKLYGHFFFPRVFFFPRLFFLSILTYFQHSLSVSRGRSTDNLPTCTGYTDWPSNALTQTLGDYVTRM